MTLTPEQIAEVRTMLKLDAAVADDQVGSKIVEALKSGAATLADLQTVKASLTAKDSEVKTLTGQVASLQAGKAPEIDPDSLESSAELVTTKLSRLVETGRITPAVKDKLVAALVGPADKRQAICLSRKAATHAGLPAPLANAVLEALESNDAAQLAKIVGEKTGSQRVSLSRNDPEPDPTKPDPWVAELIGKQGK
jgi:hypothetical protein